MPDPCRAFAIVVRGHRHRMITAGNLADSAVSTATPSRPPMPSITASALLESRLLLALTRRTLAGLLARV